MLKTIIDISHHQDPKKMNYDLLAKEVDLVIIRTQYGSRLEDRYYKIHHREFQKRNIPTAAYAWVRGVSVTDMRKEAQDFYYRTKSFQPTFWFLDVEEKSMANMRKGVSAYVQELRKLGAHKIGIYVGHHLYKSFRLNMEEVEAVWLPHYGKNNGKITSKPKYPCDFHQYTDKGRLRGYDGPLDLNRWMGTKTWSFFTSRKENNKQVNTHKYYLPSKTASYMTAHDAKLGVNKVGTVSAGSYYVYNKKDGMVNVTKVKNRPGSWINPKNIGKYITVKKGDTLSQIAQANGLTLRQIQSLNPQILNINRIYPGDSIRIK